MRKKLLTSIVAGAWACTGLAPAMAQVTEAVPAKPADTSEAASQSTGGIEVVVVTAEKRKNTAQNTPIAMSVISADSIKKNGVGDIAQLATIAPSINLGQNAGASTVAVRGVSSRDITEIGDPAVAINIDGVFLQRPTGMNASFYDLERIEVLRGPQGTLYGRNATGGVVNLITKKPTQELGGYASTTFGNYNTINLEGAINTPLTDTLAMRTSFVSRSHSGYRDNGAAGRGDDESSKGGRLQLLFTPTKELNVLLSGSYLAQGGIGPVYDGIVFNSAQTVPPTDPDAIKSFPLSDRGDFNVKRSNLLAQVDYDFGAATLTYIGGYVGLDFKHAWDNDGQVNRYFVYDRDEKSKDTSHEFRLGSNNKQGLLWQTGVYFYKQDIDLNNNFLLTPNKNPVSVREYHFDVESKSYAAFGQASYDITEKLRASAGIRYSKDEKSRTGFSYVGSLTQDVSNGRAVRGFATENTSATSSKVTWHTGLDYQLNRQQMIYAKADTGYKSGGFTIISPYDAETLLAYEIGSKNRFMKNTVQVNLAAFYYDYKNQQVTQFISSGPLSGQSTVLNAGKSEIYGVELETTWMPTPDDKLDFSVANVRGEFTDFKVANGASNLNLSGNQVIQSPKLSISAGYEHSFRVLGGVVTPRVQSQYRSASYLTFYNRPNDRQRAYNLTDVSLSYAPENNAWSAQAYVRNAGNTVVLSNADQGGPYGATRYQFGAPRTMGVRLQTTW